MIVYEEPLGKYINAIMYLTEHEAIRRQRCAVPPSVKYPYKSHALADFCSIHWAWEEECAMPNRVKCLACGTIIESKFTHDFQTCGCDNKTFIDGGDAYTRVGGADLSKVEVLQDNEGEDTND